MEQIRERDLVEGTFLVADKIMAMAKNGKPYMTLRLADRTGDVEGRIWDRVDEYNGRFEKNDFVQIRAKASVYLGKMQLIIQDLTPVPEDHVDLGDYLPVSDRSTEQMQGDFRAKVDNLQDPHLKRLMQAFMADHQFFHRYSIAPAAKAMHHVFLGGLLEHSLAVADLAEDIGRRYPGLNVDLLVVGALLHDIGKVTELSYDRAFDYTDEGKLLGHIVIGVEMVEDKIRAIDDFPARLAVHVKHMLLSHHGQYEYGSPKRPKTLEAVILNYLDDLDSKINGVRTHIAKDPDRGGPWTSYHRLYDRYFYKEPVGGSGPVVTAPPAVSQPPAPVKAPAVPARGKKEEKPRRGHFGFTLGEQLSGKNLDLFSASDEEKE